MAVCLAVILAKPNMTVSKDILKALHGVFLHKANSFINVLEVRHNANFETSYGLKFNISIINTHRLQTQRSMAQYKLLFETVGGG